jgi:hypothetical protein
VAIRAEPPDGRPDMMSANATQAQTVRPLQRGLVKTQAWLASLLYLQACGHPGLPSPQPADPERDVRVVTLEPTTPDTWFVHIWQDQPHVDSTSGILVFQYHLDPAFAPIPGRRSLPIEVLVPARERNDPTWPSLQPDWPIWLDFSTLDSVDISLNPHETHSGFHLVGRLMGDSIQGTICANSYEHVCRRRGSFLSFRQR